MPEPLVVADLSEFDGLTDDDEAWLERLQRHVRASNYLVRLGEAAVEEDVVVRRTERGRWAAGRYIGELSFEGRRLEVVPRLGELVVERWLGEVLNLVAVPDTAARRGTASFIARLMGAVWCRALGEASRHGPPAFRREHLTEGLHVRGRLDVRRTVRVRASGSPHVASVTSFRDVDNDVSRVVVAAERALRDLIGHDQWHTPRVREVLPSLHAAVGTRPQLPDLRGLTRIRYTPITRPFKTLAELSWRIAKLEGFGATDEEGSSEGLLLDAAELWELFLLHALRRALPQLTVDHGTTSTEAAWLLTSADGQLGLGRLKPDLVVRDGDRVVAVLDAKYKRLQDMWPERPLGVDRGDLYQLTSYLAGYAAEGAKFGALLYPDDPNARRLSTAEKHGPWTINDEQAVRFERVPLEPDAAAALLAALLRPTTNHQGHERKAAHRP